MIDRDDVIYAGEERIEEGDVFVQRLLQKKIDLTFLSNNSSRSRRVAVEKLDRSGITGVTEGLIYTSAMATATFFKEEFSNCTAFKFGEGGPLTSLEDHGIQLVDQAADIVILGQGVDLEPKMVRTAVDMILNGARFIATNRDLAPRKAGWNNLGIAATAAMIGEGRGRKAFVIGKPSPVMMRSAAAYMVLRPEETTVIGDTVETDIIGGVYMGFKTVLGLSGNAGREQVDRDAYKPNLVVDSADQIEFPLNWWSAW